MSECAFPEKKTVTAYRDGCRCDRCRLGKSKEKKYKQKYKYRPARSVQLRNDVPFVRKTERPTSTAFGGC